MKNKPPKFWTEQHTETLRKCYPDMTIQEVIAALDHEFVEHQIKYKANRMGIKKSEAFLERFGFDKYGRLTGKVPPHNTGKSMPSRGRTKECHFKNNHLPHNWLPVGTIRFEKDGYQKIKIAERDQWELLHREVWKRETGSYPPDDCVIIFKDGNNQNCDISNIEMITKVEHMKRNSVQNLPKPLKQVIALRAAIRRKVNAGTK
jgi:hypothetical protein